MVDGENQRSSAAMVLCSQLSTHSYQPNWRNAVGLRHMPEGTRWTRPDGGMCLWLELPPGFDASELLIHAKERGVLFAPGRYFYVQNPLPNTLRLGYAGLDEKQIARGVATLADLLRVEMRKRQRGVRRAERSRVALV